MKMVLSFIVSAITKRRDYLFFHQCHALCITHMRQLEREMYTLNILKLTEKHIHMHE